MRRLSLLLAAVLVASGLEVVSAAIAAPANPAVAPVTQPDERPDVVSARMAARASGRRVEVAGLRSEVSTTYVNPDGTLTDELSQGPVRTRRGEGWVPIDTTLVTGESGVHPVAAVGSARFSAGGEGLLASVAAPSGRVGLDWSGSLPPPELSGSTATYRDVLPEVDLLLTALPAGFEQSFVLRSRPRSAPVFRLPLSGAGLSPRRLPSGATELVDADGSVVVSVGAPVMWDATRDSLSGEPRRVAPVASALVGQGSATAIELRPDPAFLADPALVYPVTVDPTVTLGRSSDTYVQQNAASTNYDTATQLRAGLATVGAITRSYLKFDVSAYAGKHVVDAAVKLTNSYSPTCVAGAVYLYKVTSSWTSSTMTWSSGQPTSDTSAAVASASGAYGGPTCSSWGWFTWSNPTLTQLVADWASGAVANHGLRVTPNEIDTTRYRVFVSGEGSAGNQPKLEVTYNSYPNTTTWPAPSSASSSAPSYVTTTQPTLSTVVSDPDGGTVSARFYVHRNDTGAQVINSAAGATVSSGSRSPYTVGTGSALVDGVTYKMRSKAYDAYDAANSYDLSKSYSAYTYFTVDATRPVAPAVSSSTHPSGQWAGTDGGTASFSFSPGTSTDVVGYWYRLVENPVATYTSASSASLPVSEGSHTLRVRSVDRAGNQSDATLYSFQVGQAAVSTPVVGGRTEAQFTLSAEAVSTATALTWRWRRSESDTWADLTGLTMTSGSAISQPLTVTSGAPPVVRWDAATQVGTDGPLQLSATVATTSGTVTTAARQVVLDRADFGSVTATAAVGPGSVNLLTGNYAVSATDVSVDAYDSELTVSRSVNSRAAGAEPDGPFGPGWVSSVPVVTAGSDYTGLSVSGNLVTVTMAGGDTLGFTRNANGSYTSEHGVEDLKLTYLSGPSRYDLTDVDGNVTGFTQPAGAASWLPTSVTQPGDTSSTSYGYETVDVDPTATLRNVTRVTSVMAPQPPGVTCTLNSPSVRGCRSLSFGYAAGSTSLPGDTAATWGDYPHRLASVSLTAWDPDAGAMATVALAAYGYDSGGRLRTAWDPRLPELKTTYGYDTAGHLTSLTPPAEETWTFAYAAAGGDPDTGRLRSVSRPTLTAPSTATTTVIYGVPVSGTGAPWDLSASQLDRTGQTDRPTDATAVFPPDTAATLGSDPDVVPGSYDRAVVHYLDAAGREVNTADAAGGIDTTEHDSRGSVVRTLTAGNRQRAFDRSGADSAAEEAVIAATLSSTTAYSPDGLEVWETFGPEHDVLVLDLGAVVRARAHTVRTYDQSAPAGGPFHLVTTTASGARVVGESSDRDVQTTVTEYGTTTASWQLGQPTAMIADPAGLAIATRSAYSSEGLVLSQTLPAGGTSTNTAATRLTRYYTAGTHPVDSACGNRPEWVNLVCATAPGGQPASGPVVPTTYTTYDLLNRPRVVIEKNGATTLRTTTVVYDTAGRPWKTSVTASTGTALPMVETYYDGNGRAAETRSLDGSGVITSRVTRTYDSLGRLTSYADANGNTATTTYDLLGRPVTTDDGKGTQTRYYDENGERRGLPTRLVDSHAGTWSASYDVEGTPTVDWPNGLRATTVVDEAGTPVELTYTKTTSCVIDCVWLSESVRESVHGQWLERTSTLSSQSYGYDAAGRLVSVADRVAGECATQVYVIDGGGSGNSNRSRLDSYDPGTDGECQTASLADSVSYGYDAADRITTSGVVYDVLGRTTSVPDADVGGSGGLTVAYHVNDVVSSINQAGGVSASYTLDVDGQRVRSWVSAGMTRTHHYDGDGDGPAWTQESASAWTRMVGGLAGGLAAVYDSAAGAVVLQLANLHGDVVATASPSGSVTSLLSVAESTEFGAPRVPVGTRYAWLGAKQRAADTPGGLVLMGVRLYNPATGRFLQTDPVYGGSANAYDYAAHDPINNFDLDGLALCRDCLGGGIGGVLSAGAASLAKAYQLGRSIASSATLRFTPYALARITGRDGGRGVAVWAIRATLANPSKVMVQVVNGETRFRFEGRYSTVITNLSGRVVNAWARTSVAFTDFWQGCGRCT